MTPSGEPPTYGQSTAWKPERPSMRLFPLIISWLATGIALVVASWLLPGVDIENFWGALLVAAIVAALNLQTRPFILHPMRLEVPPGPILGAASVHGILARWRQELQGAR